MFFSIIFWIKTFFIRQSFHASTKELKNSFYRLPLKAIFLEVEKNNLGGELFYHQAFGSKVEWLLAKNQASFVLYLSDLSFLEIQEFNFRRNRFFPLQAWLKLSDIVCLLAYCSNQSRLKNEMIRRALNNFLSQFIVQHFFLSFALRTDECLVFKLVKELSPTTKLALLESRDFWVREFSDSENPDELYFQEAIPRGLPASWEKSKKHLLSELAQA